MPTNDSTPTPPGVPPTSAPLDQEMEATKQLADAIIMRLAKPDTSPSSPTDLPSDVAPLPPEELAKVFDAMVDRISKTKDLGSPEHLQWLADQAKGLDVEVLRQVSVEREAELQAAQRQIADLKSMVEYFKSSHDTANQAAVDWCSALGIDAKEGWARWADFTPLIAGLAIAKNNYLELIMAVSPGHPGETRHQTALRYIKKMEEPSTTCSASGAPDGRTTFWRPQPPGSTPLEKKAYPTLPDPEPGQAGNDFDR